LSSERSARPTDYKEDDDMDSLSVHPPPDVFPQSDDTADGFQCGVCFVKQNQWKAGEPSGN